jgi:hypothetical protein
MEKGWEQVAMSKIKVAVLASCLLATLLPGCSHYEPPAQELVLVGQRPAKAIESNNTLSAATAFCKLETQRKGIKSIAGIFSRLRHGSADEDFIACMKDRGYEVAQ